MKRIISLALVTCLLLSLVGCVGRQQEQSNATPSVGNSNTPSATATGTPSAENKTSQSQVESSTQNNENETSLPTDTAETPNIDVEDNTTVSLKKGDKVFVTEDIVRIKIYWYYGMTGADIPADLLADMVEWIGTFTVGDEAELPVAPGTNNYRVDIEYSNNKIISNGVDTIEIDNTIYSMNRAHTPDWLLEFMNSKI